LQIVPLDVFAFDQDINISNNI